MTGAPDTYRIFLSAVTRELGSYLFLSGPPFAPDEANPEGPELQACQAAYRKWVTASGEHYDSLTTKEKLIEDVLVLPFPGLGGPKPISLHSPLSARSSRGGMWWSLACGSA